MVIEDASRMKMRDAFMNFLDLRVEKLEVTFDLFSIGNGILGSGAQSGERPGAIGGTEGLFEGFALGEPSGETAGERIACADRVDRQHRKDRDESVPEDCVGIAFGQPGLGRRDDPGFTVLRDPIQWQSVDLAARNAVERFLLLGREQEQVGAENG